MPHFRMQMIGLIAGVSFCGCTSPLFGTVWVELQDRGFPQNGDDTVPQTLGVLFRLVSDEGPILAIDFATRNGPMYEDGFGFYGHLVQRGFDPTGQGSWILGLPETTNPGPDPADNLSPSVWNLDSHFLPIPGAIFTAAPSEGNTYFITSDPTWPASTGFFAYGLGNGWTNPPTETGFLTSAIDLSAQPSSSVDLAYLAVWGYFGNTSIGPVAYRGNVQTQVGWTLVEGSINSTTIPEPASTSLILSVMILSLRKISRSVQGIST